MHLSFLIKAERLTSITGGFSMRKNRFCTFTLISALMLAALPASLAAAGSEGGTASASSSSLPASRNMTLTIRPSANGSYHPDGSAYTAYRVMSFTYESDPDSSSYGNWSWDLANGFTYPGEGSFSPDAFGSYPAAKLQSLANQLALQVDDSTMADKLPQKALSEGSCSWTTDQAGIYLVCETVTAPGNFPAAPFLVSLPYTDPDHRNAWIYDVEAAPKGSAVGLQKVIHNAKGSYLNEEAYEGSLDTVAKDDTVEYRISTRIPAYTEVYFGNEKHPTFTLIDTMAKGLTILPATIAVTSGETTLRKDTDYTQTCETGSNGITTLTISLAQDYLSNEAHHNSELVLSFSATVNENVSLADDGNDNTVLLRYSYDPKDPDQTKEIDDEATVYSFGIEIEKYDPDAEAGKEKLAGAEFALFKESSKGCTAAQALAQDPYRPVGVTNGNGILDFKALDAGTYYLKEVKAPEGYSLLMNPIKVEIIPDSVTGQNGAEVVNSNAVTIKVNGTTASEQGTEGNSRILQENNRETTVIVSAVNHKGFTLPLTGGNGIAVILLTALAGIVTISLVFLRGSGRERKNSTGQI